MQYVFYFFTFLGKKQDKNDDYQAPHKPAENFQSHLPKNIIFTKGYILAYIHP